MGIRGLRFQCNRCGLAVARGQARRVLVVGISVWYCRACWLAIRQEIEGERQA
jgi:late competence protein required for DNA uptake (superfamily II DNA/RNA helicase)